MMQSMRLRLFLLLLATTSAIWLLGVAWTYVSVQTRVEKALDARLMEAARMVSSLITDHHIDVAAAVSSQTDAQTAAETDAGEYRRQLSCQIWSLQGQLVSRSESAPRMSLSDHDDGFSETTVDGVKWRVYAVVNPVLNVRVLVGDSLDIRDRLVADVVTGQLVPAFASLPLLALLIWLSVARGLAPLNRIAALLAARSADELHPVTEADAPGEVRPLLRALNALFHRVSEAREREKTFTAYAAHELKTPLAGLKTQAQVAAMSSDEAVRSQALRQISTSVDRTGRLVRQLIDMATVDSAERGTSPQHLVTAEFVQGVLADLDGVQRGHGLNVTIAVGEVLSFSVRNENLLRLALRNVLENAMQYAPETSTIVVAASKVGDRLDLSVVDQGPGIDEDEHQRVRERFHRGRSPAGNGSGLGLAIVEMAMNKLDGELHFRRTEHGFSAVLSLPFAETCG
ncbi:sensor histidine kinase [Rhizobium sp. SL86]|uniref:sensor histidine kinase n=1 Tax=Rhizobium sp. SL86 TaxID=2995148 RepID=UPI00227361B9|nr:sensor histidine kinase [Rhizobium sp. SL86]MCY1666355.1 sensor histidine kinase N-terminal domain-containing protein [Rhizobium sp. SL86]